MNIKCLVCGKSRKVNPIDIKRGAKFCSLKCCWKFRKLYPNKGAFKKNENIGKKNFNWKGDKVKQCALHQWIYYHKGSPKVCKHCGITNKEKRLHWANMNNHIYRHNLSDYIALCPSCHKKYDNKLNNRVAWNKGKPWSEAVKMKVSKSKMGSIPWNKGKKFPYKPRKTNPQ